VVHEGETAEELALKFSREYNLNEEMEQKLTELLQKQMGQLLQRIDEDDQGENNSDNHTENQE